MHMKKNNKILIVIIPILFLVAVLVTLVVLGMKKEQRRNEKAIGYLSQFPKNENVIYVDRYNRIYLHNRTIEPPDSISNNENSILYVNANNIFYYKRDNDTKKITVYRTDYSYCKTEKVYSYKTDNVISISMPNENTICYSQYEKYYIYCIDSEQVTLITKAEYEEKAYCSNEYYSVEKESKHGYIRLLRITEKNTGKTKVIEKDSLDNLLKVEQASVLNNYEKLEILDFILKNDQIYIQCWSCGVVTTFLYDFDSEFYTYIDSFYEAKDYLNLQTFFLN